MNATPRAAANRRNRSLETRVSTVVSMAVPAKSPLFAHMEKIGTSLSPSTEYKTESEKSSGCRIGSVRRSSSNHH